MKDLGVYMNSFIQPSFKYLYNTIWIWYIYIQNKASPMLDFLIWSYNNFDNLLSLKSLYRDFIRSISDFNSIVKIRYISHI